VLDWGLGGKTAVVVGAGPGMGRACALALAEAGAAVVCLDISEAEATASAEAVEATGGQSRAIVVDVLQRAEVRRAIEQVVSELGDISAVVNVVGLSYWNSVLDIEDKDWDYTVDLCLRQGLYVFQEAAAAMIRGGNGGSLVAISSIGGLTALPGVGAYGAAKAGLIALARTMAIEFAPHGIRVNTVAPGIVRTPRIASFQSPEQLREQDEAVPLGRMGRPEDIAAAVVFLLSDLSSYVTGQTLVVDGGATVTYPLPLPARTQAPLP
jgi:3-oxoacyl-[acyl-carrier protein] reductase